MLIEEICDRLIAALKDAGYNDSTIFNYRGVVRRFKEFYEKDTLGGFTQYSLRSDLAEYLLVSTCDSHNQVLGPNSLYTHMVSSSL